MESEFSEYHYTFYGDGDNSTPIITLEVMSDSSNTEPTLTNYGAETTNHTEAGTDDTTGMHFLTETPEEDPPVESEKEENGPKARHDLLEYMTRNDGSVICKLCGEILQSRTHWYRHKYKLHVIQPLNPSPLFQCEQCLVYFKSRKGYIGHIASRHSEVLSDSSPVLTNSQAEAIAKEKVASTQTLQEVKEEPDPELMIPTSSVPNYQTTIVKPMKTTESKKPCRAKEQTSTNDWDVGVERRRSQEEKLVADIIERVRRECEAQGSGGAARRGYTRRTTVMHT